MRISHADTAKKPKYFRFVCKKTAHFANACEANTNGLISFALSGRNSNRHPNALSG